jgi:Fe-S cluster assembly iron-binding protein IscA
VEENADMLAVTDQAAAALAQRLSERGLPDSSGHRITRLPADNGAAGSYRLQPATAPALQDAVVRCGETQVFVALEAVEPLDGAVLDVTDGSEGPALVLRRGTRGG